MYVRYENYADAVSMYLEVSRWEDAFRLAPHLSKEVRDKLVGSRAQQLVKQGRLTEAEKLYLFIENYQAATEMYYVAQNYPPMLKIIEKYVPQHLDDIRKQIAEVRYQLFGPPLSILNFHFFA